MTLSQGPSVAGLAALPIRNSKGEVTVINITPCYPTSFDNYRVYSSASTLYYSFLFFFTFACKDSSLEVQIGRTVFSKISMATPGISTPLRITLTRAELFKELNYLNGELEILIFLNGEMSFAIPFTFINYSDYLPDGLITQDLKINANLIATFSFKYQYATKIEYEIFDEKGVVIYGRIIGFVDYSVNLVERPLEFS